MHPDAPPSTLGLARHGVRGHLDVQDATVVDGISVESERARARQPTPDRARPPHVGVRVGQRVPGLTHTDQSPVRDQQANGLVIEAHPP
jgi:hypothetical protein